MEKCHQIYFVNQLTNINISHHKAVIPDTAAKPSPTARLSEWNTFTQQRRKTKKRLSELWYHLTKRGYSNLNIKGGFCDGDLVSRKSLQVYNSKKVNTRVPFVLDHPCFDNVTRTIRQYQIFPETLCVAFRKSKSFKGLLVRAEMQRA
jgi:hypothetical protein